MKLNPDKCHLLMSGFKHEVSFVKLSSNVIWEEKEVRLLGVTLDRHMKFDTHISNICNTANRKLCALMRLAKVLSFEKKRLLFKTFFESQFNYCPLVWMLHSRKSQNKINALHERALRFLYSDYISTYDTLLEKDHSRSVHDRNIQALAVEIYKYLNNLSSIFEGIFTPNYHRYNLRTDNNLALPSIHTTSYGEQSLKYLGPLLWNIVPAYMKQASCLSDFKSLIKTWKPVNCPCRCCKDYIANVGFMSIL